MANIILKVLLTLFSYISLPFIILIVASVATFRYFVSKIVPMMEPTIGKILTTHSSIPGSDKIYKAPMMSLVSVSSFTGTIDLSILRKEFESRVVLARDEAGTLLRPELRQYVTQRCGFMFWKDEPNFSIDQHIRLYDGKFKNIYTEADHITPEMVVASSEEFLYAPFLAKKSPWEMHLFHNYKDSPESPISTALALRIHHSLADGMTLSDIAKDFLNKKIENSKLRPHRNENFFQTLCSTVRYCVMGPYEAISSLLDSVDSPIWKVKENNFTKTFNFGVSPMISLARIKQVRQISNSSFTAVIMECFTAALRRFMKEAGHEIPKKIHCVNPLPMPGHPIRKMRNHMTSCIVPLPVGMNDRISRLRTIDADFIKLRTSTYPTLTFYFIGIIGSLLRFMIAPFTVNNITTAITSNFMGPQEPSNFNEHSLQSTYFSATLHPGTCSMGFSAMSSVGNMRFVFGMDNALVHTKTLPASLLVSYFLQELDNIERDSTV